MYVNFHLYVCFRSVFTFTCIFTFTFNGIRMFTSILMFIFVFISCRRCCITFFKKSPGMTQLQFSEDSGGQRRGCCRGGAGSLGQI